MKNCNFKFATKIIDYISVLQKGDSTPTRRKSRSASRGHSKKTSSPVRKFHSTSRGRVAESSPSSQSASSSDEKPALKKVK